MLFSHLNSETNTFMGKSMKEKMEWINTDHFVYYPKAQACLNELKRVYDIAEAVLTNFPADQNGVSIIGHSGTGKTMILREFMQQNMVQPHPSYERYQVAYALLRDSITGLTGVYSSLLGGLGHPYGNAKIVGQFKIKISDLEDTLLYLLKKSEVRMFFIDEFQHALGRNQKAVINQLKRTMLEAHIPFVPVGTPDVVNVLALDDQLPDRCPVKEETVLDYWINGKDFRSFLASYERFLPFSEPSGLSSKDLAKIIFDKVKYPDPRMVRELLRPLYTKEKEGKTNLRNLANFLKKIAGAALRQKLNHINEEIIIAARS